MRTTILIVLMIAAIVAPPIAHAQQTTFGTTPDIKTKPINLSEAVSSRSFDAPLLVTARVTEVCQETGCWMILQEGDTKVRVTFKDYGFFVPKKIVGKNVEIQGVLTETIVSEADARHYAEDAGLSAEAVDLIRGDQRELAFEATGVRLVQ